MSTSSALLPAGSRIGVVAPAHTFSRDAYAAGKAWLSTHGYTFVEYGIDAPPHRYYAADDATRRGSLLTALADPNVDAVWALRGGSGVTRFLADLPLDELPDKPLLGFSDLTPLLDVWSRSGRTAIHGPVIHSLDKTDAESRAHLLALLQGRALEPLRGHSLVPGSATGPLVGGNLALVAASVGTSYAFDTRGAVLVLEDIGEHPYRIERMLAQLRDSGAFAGLAGVVLGDFARCDPPQKADYTLDDIFMDWFGSLGVPVLRGVPIGHSARNHAFIVRSSATLATDRLHLDPIVMS